jgi:hypothetical protein
MTKNPLPPEGKPFTRKMLIKEMRQRFEHLLAAGQTKAEEFEVLEDFFCEPTDEDKPAVNAADNERSSL